LVAALVGILLNARHLPFGVAIGHVLGKRLAARLVGSHLMIDESVAFALAEPDPRRSRVAYWTTGVALFVSWNVGVLLGALAGDLIGDPELLGLDAAFPAALLALLLPALRTTSARVVAATGAAIALAATPYVPQGVPVLLALVALPAALLTSRPGAALGAEEGQRRPDADEGQSR
ncbi:MAG: AzlC family ABC transporter permease, partial [Micromonosporaceae bacterium]